MITPDGNIRFFIPTLIFPGFNQNAWGFSSSNITVRPQDIAIPSINFTSDSGMPVLTFYVQLPSGNVIFSLVLSTAVEASLFLCLLVLG